MGRVIHCAVALTAAGIAPRLEAIAPLPSSPRHKNKRRGLRGCPPVGVRGRGPARAESAIEHPITRPRFRAGRKIIKGTGRRRQSDGKRKRRLPPRSAARFLHLPWPVGSSSRTYVMCGGSRPEAMLRERRARRDFGRLRRAPLVPRATWKIRLATSAGTNAQFAAPLLERATARRPLGRPKE